MKKGHKKGKKGHKMLKDKGHKKKGFKKVYHKEEWGKKKKWHDIKREKKWNTKQKKWKKKWHQEKGKKYKGKHMKKVSDCARESLLICPTSGSPNRSLKLVLLTHCSRPTNMSLGSTVPQEEQARKEVQKGEEGEVQEAQGREVQEGSQEEEGGVREEEGRRQEEEDEEGGEKDEEEEGLRSQQRWAAARLINQIWIDVYSEFTTLTVHMLLVILTRDRKSR